MYKFRIPRGEYAELAGTFDPDRSFAQQIARLAKDTGMKYVMITAKHHDGFALFDSACSDYDINPSVIVNRRVGYDFGDYLDAGDNVIPPASTELSKHWETCGTSNNSWGYKAYDHDWKTTRELLYYFIDIASKGGNYLLNVGPDGKGRVPDPCAKHLREMGEWVRTNAEAIYGTTRWKIPHEGQGETLLEGTGRRAAKGFSRKFTPEDFWFTAKGNKVYAISLVPAGDIVGIRSLNQSAGSIQRVRLLGSDRVMEWSQTDAAIELNVAGVNTGANGFAVEVTLH
jgi:alpha-L-fucosidase